MYLLKQPRMLKGWQPYVFYHDEFSKSECKAIIHMAKSVRPTPALIGGATAPEPKVRSSELRWLALSDDSRWIFDKLAAVCENVQKNWYPFVLSGFEEQIQITKYVASEGGHYDTHKDHGDGDMSVRKLSLIVVLNEKFEGGELEMPSIVGENKKLTQVKMGTVIAFPSWEHHKVNTITKGTRWSLVSWVSGPPFI